mmetsp:Transcript_13311/g.41943  ORF Transcript_13311/g.41943 Transcript_13311/m.41943 type:complete len:225 (-) Transcript_13311:805-1479(-)
MSTASGPAVAIAARSWSTVDAVSSASRARSRRTSSSAASSLAVRRAMRVAAASDNVSSSTRRSRPPSATAADCRKRRAPSDRATSTAARPLPSRARTVAPASNSREQSRLEPRSAARCIGVRPVPSAMARVGDARSCSRMRVASAAPRWWATRAPRATPSASAALTTDPSKRANEPAGTSGATRSAPDRPAEAAEGRVAGNEEDDDGGENCVVDGRRDVDEGGR